MSIYYTEDHEWVSVDGDIGTVGISPYAVKALGDVTALDMPEIDEEYDKGDEAGAVDSVKAAAEIYMPVGGTVTEINEALEEAAELLNEDPMGKAWIFKLKLSDPSELEGLMDEDAYKAYCEGL